MVDALHTERMTPSAPIPSRRQFLATMCGAAVLAVAGPALLADEAQAASGIKRRKDGSVVITVARVPSLQKVGSRVLLGTVKGAPVAVIRTGADSFEALNLRCTHQGVTVNPDSIGWLCPAHGSQFALDGALVQGPAQSSLATVRTSWNAQKGTLTVG